MAAMIVDSFEFCRLGEQASGTTPVADFPRLLADLSGDSGELRWRFEGGRHSIGLPQITMTVEGEVSLMCQRCLTPYVHPVSSVTVLVLAKDEEDADGVEERLDDESIDVIVGSASLDLLQLVEDEALLSLPLSPRHEQCPGAVPKGPADKLESPFSVLKGLKS